MVRTLPEDRMTSAQILLRTPTKEAYLAFLSGLKPNPNRADFNSIRNVLNGLPMTPRKARVQQSDIAVIVETRPIPWLDELILLFSEKTGCLVQFFHGTDSLVESSVLKNLVAKGRVRLTPLGVSEITLADYNALLLSPRFWKSLAGRRKVLVFQSDTLILKARWQWPPKFHSMDYVGGLWSEKRPIGAKIQAGNGGFSLRDWSLSYAATKAFPTHSWPGGEDGFFGFHIEFLKGVTASTLDTSEFCLQRSFDESAIGIHKFADLPPEQRDALLALHPEYQRFFSNGHSYSRQQ